MRTFSTFTAVLGALLCATIIAVHVDDQGGLTTMADPTWFGWGYRATEIAAMLAGGWLMFTAGVAADAGRRSMLASWTLALLVAIGPFAGYLLTRTVGLPQDSGDIGNWADPVGTASLIAEAALITLSATRLWQLRQPAAANRAQAPATSRATVAA